MSLEGRLRDLGLAEVMQLLGLSRKTGSLELQAALNGRAAEIRLVNGAVVDATEWPLSAGRAEASDLPVRSAKLVAACVFELLLWPDGDFHFIPTDAGAPDTGVRLSVDSLLMQAASHGEVWNRIRDRIPHQRVIPAFVDVEPQHLPLLRLAPQEWEILTRVDGVRDLQALATVLGRELLDVAENVHRLISEGVLVLRESVPSAARHPTPPIGTTVNQAELISPPVADPVRHAPAEGADLWIPDGDDDVALAGYHDDDSLFDPVMGGMLAADGRPRRRTTPRGVHAVSASPAKVFPIRPAMTVASTVVETSVAGGEASLSPSDLDASTLCQHGDDAARRGDLAGALRLWSAALRSNVMPANTDRIREAIALAARLHALLHPAAERQ